MKRPSGESVSENKGFTLVEVILALAIAALGFGVVLHSVGLQMTLVSSSVERHQMLMYASEALEAALARGTLGDEEVEVPIGRQSRNQDKEGVPELTGYLYNITAKPVTADPRVQQVTVTVKGRRGQVRLSAYRLRVRRGESDSGSDSSDSGSDTSSQSDSSATPTEDASSTSGGSNTP